MEGLNNKEVNTNEEGNEGGILITEEYEGEGQEVNGEMNANGDGEHNITSFSAAQMTTLKNGMRKIEQRMEEEQKEAILEVSRNNEHLKNAKEEFNKWLKKHYSY
ncbi:MAG: hypothetical protein AAFO15_00485 [Pseudomonadota bacterium]